MTTKSHSGIAAGQVSRGELMVAAAAREIYTAIRQDGTQKNVVGQMQPRADLYDILGYTPPK